eukprot:1080827-Alexandrium_andersonii.AAC.1
MCAIAFWRTWARAFSTKVLADPLGRVVDVAHVLRGPVDVAEDATMVPLAPRVEEVAERSFLPKMPHIGREVLEDDVVPIPLAEKVLRREAPHLGGDADAAE